MMAENMESASELKDLLENNGEDDIEENELVVDS